MDWGLRWLAVMIMTVRAPLMPCPDSGWNWKFVGGCAGG
jgi:hypothetical protein